jgi:hypothetical protein
MKPRSKRIARVMGITVAAFAATFVLAGQALGTHYAGFHWPEASGLHNIEFVSSGTTGWGIDTAASNWNSGVTYEDVASGTGCAGSGWLCVPVSVSNYGDTGWLGATVINFTGDHINSASIDLNTFYNPTATARLTSSCQEEGHAQGLTHFNTGSSCMNDTTLSYTTPIQHDYDELNAVYNHHP